MPEKVIAHLFVVVLLGAISVARTPITANSNQLVASSQSSRIVARGDPRKLRNETETPFVHNFFTRSSPGVSANQGG